MSDGGWPNGPNGPIGPQGFPVPPPNAPPGPGYSPGSIRNTLGSGLKNSGVFQKDGHVQNLRGGFIGSKQPPMAPNWGGAPPMNPQGSPPMGQSFGTQPGMGGPGMGQPGMGQPGMGQGMPGNQGGMIANQGGMPGGENMAYGQFMGGGGFNQPRQLVLQATQPGISGNGVATISPDNSFMLIANLPPPHSFLNQGSTGYSARTSAVYATYLVDKKGKNGFLAGILTPIGNGAYRAQFRSSVPLIPYERVIVSVENPQALGQAPNGPIILKVKEPMGAAAFLSPMKRAAGSVWGKISGLRKKPPVPVPPVGEGAAQGAAQGVTDGLIQGGIPAGSAPGMPGLPNMPSAPNMPGAPNIPGMQGILPQGVPPVPSPVNPMQLPPG